MKERKTLFYVGKIHEGANAFIVHELEKAGVKGIVPSHGSILIALYQNKGPMTMKEIAEKIRRTQPTVTVLVDKLVEHGYVTREKSAEDARTSYVRLTKNGEGFKKLFFDISENMNKRMHSGLSETEEDQLVSLLEKASANW